MTITQIYFEADNLKPFVEWVKTQPKGMCAVLIGANNPDTFNTRELVEAVSAEGRGLAAWLMFTVQSGMMRVKVGSKVDLPVGVPMEEMQDD